MKTISLINKLEWVKISNLSINSFTIISKFSECEIVKPDTTGILQKKGIRKTMEILNLNNLPKEIENFYEILNRGTDLACVLVGTNFLDVSLHDMLSL